MEEEMMDADARETEKVDGMNDGNLEEKAK